MELSGATPVDTLYEFMGYRLGAQLADALIWNWIFVGLLALAALLRLFWIGLSKGSYVQLAVYPLYLGFMLALISPTEVKVGMDTLWDPRQFVDDGTEKASSRAHFVIGTRNYERDRTVEVPRILALLHAASDKLLFALAGSAKEETRGTLFRWQAIAAAVKQTQIFDERLRSRFRGFLRDCYWPAVAKSRLDALAHPPLQDGGALPYSKRCRSLSIRIYSSLQNHIREDPHRRIIDAYREAARDIDPSDPIRAKLENGSFETAYARRVLYNETFGPAARNEMATLAEAVPEFTNDAKFYGTGTGVQGLFSGMITTAGSIFEAISQEGLGPMLYYRFTLFAPYLYGLILAVLLIGFPVACFWSLWPGKWTALLNFLKIWISVKLWPVFWSFLSALNDHRLVLLDPEDPRGIVGTGGASEMFAAVAAMYVLIPVLSFIIVHLAVSAANVGISQFVSAGGGGLSSLLALTWGTKLLGQPAKSAVDRFRRGRQEPQEDGAPAGGDLRES